MAELTEKQQIFQNLRQIADAVHALFGPNCEVVIHDLQQNSERGAHRHNYKSVTADGRCLKSATTIIRDNSGKAVAAFCINLDTTQYFNAIQALLPFIHDLETGIYPSKETFADSASDTIRTLFVQAVEEIGTQPAAMSIDEKTRFIEKMKQNGVFQFKGAVEQVAELMDVTKCTVYNYLKKIP